MKKKPVRVTPIMKDRIRAEMKRHNQKDQDIADILYITRQQYSRIINGKYQLMPEHLNKMVSIWGVRENYLLGIDAVRSEEDMMKKRDESRSAMSKAERDFLKAIGINVEWCELVHFRISEIIKDKETGLDIDRMISFFDPYICEPRENWNRFKNLLDKMVQTYDSFYDRDFYFITSGLILVDINDIMMEVEEFGSDAQFYEKIDKFPFYTYKIEIDGTLIGYCSLNYNDVIANTVKALFSSLIDARKKTQNFINLVDNSVEMMEKEEAEKNEPLPFE